MKLGGLILYTQYFEDYLSFLAEVLELELTELTDSSMKLSLEAGFLEIKKIPQGSEQLNTTVVFELDQEQFFDLAAKISFFYYRKGPSRFLLIKNHASHCELTDPDGRIWKFFVTGYLQRSLSFNAEV